MTDSELARFLAKVTFDAQGCWVWTGAKTKNGYANFAIARQANYAHRLSFEHYVGAIPEDMQIDHLCSVRHCVNPWHLEVVTLRENLLRSPNTITSRHAARTHCNHGHEFTAANTGHSKEGWRFCRQCSRDSARRYSQRKRLTAKLGTEASLAFLEKLEA
jgi:hypothetical protein